MSLRSILGSFGIEASEVGQTTGALLRTTEIRLDAGTQIGKLQRRSADIALAMKTANISVRAIPERGTVAIEVGLADLERRGVPLRISKTGALPIYFGETPTGAPVVGDMADLPHLLVAGTTGSGKTTALRAYVAHLLYQSSADVRIIDPKRTEFTGFAGAARIEDDAVETLDELVDEMEARYATPSDQRIVLIIDELADLVLSRKGAQKPLIRLAQKGRAAGIHIIAATQRPSTDVVSGLLKANFPARLSFRLRTMTDSRVILDANGAEGLVGRGDALLLRGATPERLHAPQATLAQEQAACARRRHAEASATYTPTFRVYCEGYCTWRIRAGSATLWARGGASEGCNWTPGIEGPEALRSGAAAAVEKHRFPNGRPEELRNYTWRTT